MEVLVRKNITASTCGVKPDFLDIFLTYTTLNVNRTLQIISWTPFREAQNERSDGLPF